MRKRGEYRGSGASLIRRFRGATRLGEGFMRARVPTTTMLLLCVLLVGTSLVLAGCDGQPAADTETSISTPTTATAVTAVPPAEAAGEYVSVLHPYHSEFLDAPNYLIPESIALAEGFSLPDFPPSVPAQRITSEMLPDTGLAFMPKPVATGHYLWFSPAGDLSPGDVTLGSQDAAAAAARDFLEAHALWDDGYSEPKVSVGSSETGPDGTSITSWLVRFERGEAAPGLERYVSVRVGDKNEVTQVSLAIPRVEPVEGKLVRLRPVAEVVTDLEAWREGDPDARLDEIGGTVAGGGTVRVKIRGVSLAYEDPHSGDEPIAVPVYRFEVEVRSVDGGATAIGVWTVVAAADVVRSSEEAGTVVARESTTSVSMTEATAPIPAGKPIEIQRFEQGKELWKAWIEGDTVIWMESAGAAAKTGLAYSASSGWDTIFRVASVGGGDVQEIAGVRLPAPKIPGTPPYSLTLPLAWAAVLPGSADAPFKLVWAAPPEALSETYLFHGVSSWSPGGTPLEVLPESSVSLRAQASGDAVAIPVPVASFSETGEDSNDPANWDKLLMMTANLSAPVAVDPTAPRLPDSALAGLSPYFSLLTSDDSRGPGVKIFDLRTGEKPALESPASYPYPIIAGHYAAWWTENGDVYLADLDAGSPEKVLSLSTDQNSWPSVALGDEWLVVLKPWSSFDRESAMADPSQHPGADLIALHLPDLRRVDVTGVIPKGEVGSAQVSGDNVLLTVSPAIEPMPHNEPDWVALQVLRLE